MGSVEVVVFTIMFVCVMTSVVWVLTLLYRGLLLVVGFAQQARRRHGCRADQVQRL